MRWLALRRRRGLEHRIEVAEQRHDRRQRQRLDLLTMLLRRNGRRNDRSSSPPDPDC